MTKAARKLIKSARAAVEGSLQKGRDCLPAAVRRRRHGYGTEKVVRQKIDPYRRLKTNGRTRA